MNSFCDQLIRLAAHQPAKGKTMSARKEFNHLIRSMPLRWGRAGRPKRTRLERHARRRRAQAQAPCTRLAACLPCAWRVALSSLPPLHDSHRPPLRSNTIMPAMTALTVALPPLPSADNKKGGGGGAHGGAAAQPELVTIEGIVDTIEVMTSLQKPKKVRLGGRSVPLLGGSAAAAQPAAAGRSRAAPQRRLHHAFTAN